MAASVALLGRRVSNVEPLTAPLQTMDNNVPSPGISERRYELLATCAAISWYWVTYNWRSSSSPKIFVLSLLFLPIIIFVHIAYRQDPGNRFRLLIVINVYVHEMNNMLAIMKLWESQSREEDDFENLEDTTARLCRFLKATESMDLMSKIVELKGFSGELNSSTQLLLQSSLQRTLDWLQARSFNLLGVSVS